MKEGAERGNEFLMPLSMSCGRDCKTYPVLSFTCFQFCSGAGVLLSLTVMMIDDDDDDNNNNNNNASTDVGSFDQ
jgi:hypothetical protein